MPIAIGPCVICFANLVAEAAAGHRDDAFLFAMLIVRADFAPALAGLAEQFGLALSVLRRPEPNKVTLRVPEHATVH